MRALRWLALAPAFAAALVACADTTLPGNPVGSFKVTGTIQTNSCGAGLSPPNPWSFTVALSRQRSTLYWSTLDGSPMLSGAIDANLAASITEANSANVDSTDAGAGPCDMARNDTIKITLGAGVPTPSFSGTMQYDFSAAAGADCADQLSAAGGMYATLPCTVTYALAATRE